MKVCGSNAIQSSHVGTVQLCLQTEYWDTLWSRVCKTRLVLLDYIVLPHNASRRCGTFSGVFRNDVWMVWGECMWRMWISSANICASAVYMAILYFVRLTNFIYLVMLRIMLWLYAIYGEYFTHMPCCRLVQTVTYRTSGRDEVE